MLLDLLFQLRLQAKHVIPLVNKNMRRTVPSKSVDQLDQSLQHIIDAIAKAGPGNKVFVGKFDIKDGFW